MRRTIEGSCISLMLICLSVIGSYAQTAPRDVNAESAAWQTVLSKASESAIFDNGKLQSLRLHLPKDRERYLTFEHAKDGRSFTIVEDGRRTIVVLDDKRRISTIIFPDGKKAVFEWVLGPNGFWMPASIKVDGREVGNSITEASCYDVCQNAAAAAAIALAVCVTAPGTVGCWSATASAAYATYVCYRCANPQVECPPEN